MIEDVVGTYELSSCYNVTIDCRASEMIATVRTNKIFNGKVYAKDNPNSCVTDVENGIEFSIKMGYNDIECNVKRKGKFSLDYIIVHKTTFIKFIIDIHVLIVYDVYVYRIGILQQ